MARNESIRDDSLRHLLAEKIKSRRLDIDVTQESLGEAIGTSRSQVANIEAANSGVTVEMLFYIAYALDCSPIDLLPMEDGEEAVKRMRKANVETTTQKINRLMKELDKTWRQHKASAV